ncbi:MAG: GNAT family N-acetyltransferase, partial [Brucella intermedia]
MNDEDPRNEQSFVLRVVENISEFTKDEWSSLVGASRQDANYNPFITRNFLLALEESGSVSRKAGWLPKHLRLEDDRGSLIGVVPNYLKGHSQGEYVFDHGWADAFDRAGGRYYPKFQAAVPFTPATGPRLINHVAYE